MYVQNAEKLSFIQHIVLVTMNYRKRLALYAEVLMILIFQNVRTAITGTIIHNSLPARYMNRARGLYPSARYILALAVDIDGITEELSASRCELVIVCPETLICDIHLA